MVEGGKRINGPTWQDSRWYWLDTFHQDPKLSDIIAKEGGVRLPSWVICGESESTSPKGTWICTECARRWGYVW